MTEDEMVGWHHQFNGHEFEQTSGESEGQGSLVCCIHGVGKSWTRLSDGTTRTTGAWRKEGSPSSFSDRIPISLHLPGVREDHPCLRSC